MWMCTARPLYQPGTIVRNSTMPSSPAVWLPRRNVVASPSSLPPPLSVNAE